MREIKALPLSKKDFVSFGDVIEVDGIAEKVINNCKCARYHNLAHLDILEGYPGISLFNAQTQSLPYELNMMERHPFGSQAFIPMAYVPFLITVAKDYQGFPDLPKAFISTPGQAINFHRNTWHGILTPLNAPGLFAVVDRIGSGINLQEVFFESPYIITC